jgi:hypothetical protein
MYRHASLIGLLGAALIVGACGSTNGDKSPDPKPDSPIAKRTAATAHAPSARHPETLSPRPPSRAGLTKLAIGPNYAGLGALVVAFKKSNNMVRPTVRTPGIATYKILSTIDGRVAAYAVDIPANPPMGNSDRMFLTEGVNLPDDQEQVSEKPACQVFRSKTLKTLLGKPYAEATTVTGSEEATIEAVSHASC